MPKELATPESEIILTTANGVRLVICSHPRPEYTSNRYNAKIKNWDYSTIYTTIYLGSQQGPRIIDGFSLDDQDADHWLEKDLDGILPALNATNDRAAVMQAIHQTRGELLKTKPVTEETTA